MELQYQTGFGNDCATEALPGALPQGRNSPQQCPTACTPNSCPAPPSPRRAPEPPFLAVPDPPRRAARRLSAMTAPPAG